MPPSVFEKTWQCEDVVPGEITDAAWRGAARLYYQLFATQTLPA
jgi:hypothetical protein